MTNTFMNAMKSQNNYKRTENGAIAKKSTMSKLYDLFALGGAYRTRTESDCVLLFKEAYMENPRYAMKCLTYLRDIMEGQGERRFFRVCLRWLGNNYPDAARQNLREWVDGNFIRWDDLFVLFDTPVEHEVMALIRHQLTRDMAIYNDGPQASVSLCAKWMPSENTSSATTRHNARRVMAALELTPREYRKMLSMLRERIKVVERLMSQNRWEEIDFSKLPSRAGLIYRNAFKNKGLIAEKYKTFAQDKTTKVNAGTLYPYDVVAAALKVMNLDPWGRMRNNVSLDDTERLIVNKYWDNLKDYFNGASLNAMVICDTSGSMTMGSNTVKPIDVAVSLALYTAERAKGPFANHYISFSRTARLVETKGVDFCDKVARIVSANLCENTNLQSVFDLVLNTAMQNNVDPEDMPKTLIIVSDMEVDAATGDYGYQYQKNDFMSSIRQRWGTRCGGWYDFPNLVYWNVNARNNTFLEDPRTGVTFVSGCSPVLYEQILKGLTAQDLMFQKLDSDRYKNIC